MNTLTTVKSTNNSNPILKMNTMKRIVLGICLLLSVNSFATTLTATANGNWSAAATWGGSLPANTDDFIIPSGFTVTLNTTETANSVTIQSGGTLSMTLQTLTVTASVTNNGTLKFTNGLLNIGGDFTNNSTFIYGTGTVNFNATLAANHNQNINGSIAPTFYNLTVSNSGSTNNTVLLANPITIKNNLNITAGGLNSQANLINGPGGALGTLTVSGTGSLILGSTTSNALIPFPVFKVTTLSATTTVTYQSDAVQTIQVINYGNLNVFAGSSNPVNVLSSTNNFIIYGNLQVGNGTSSGVTLNVSSNNITVNGNITIGSDGTLANLGSNIFNIEGNFTNNNLSNGFICGTSTVIFSSTSALNHNQTINSVSTVTFYNLTISNAGTTNTSVILGGTILIANGGALLLTKGILDASVSNYQITVDGTFTNNAGINAFKAQNGMVNFGGGTYSSAINGSASTTFYNVTCDPGTGDSVNINTINETVANNLVVNSGKLVENRKTVTVGGTTTAITVNTGSNIIITTGTLSQTSVTGSILNNGNIKISSTGSLLAGSITNNDTISDSIGSVVLTASLNNTGVMLFSTGTLSVAGNTNIISGSISFVTGTYTSTGNLTIGGTLSFAGAGNLKIAGNFIDNGFYTAGNSTSLFNASVAQNHTQKIGGTSSIVFYNLTANNAGTSNDTILLASPFTVNNNLSISSGVLGCQANSITGSGGTTGTFTMAANTVFLLGLTNNNAVVIFPTFKTYAFNNASTVIYQADAIETIATITYGNLSIYAGTHTPTDILVNTANFVIGGNLTIGNGTSSGVTLSISSNTLSVTNIIIGPDGTLAFTGAGALSIYGNFTNNNASNGFIHNVSTVSFAANAGVNHNQNLNSVVPITFFNLTVNNQGTTNKTVFLGQAITVNNTLSITSGILACQTNIITGPGVSTGGLTMTAGTSFLLGLTTSAVVVPLPVFKTYALNATSTIAYQTDAAEAIPTSVPFGTLAIYAGISNPIKTLSSAANFTIGGNLLIGSGSSSGVKFQISTNTLTIVGNTTIATDGSLAFTGAGGLKIAGNFTNNNVFTANSSTVTFNGTTPQTMGGNSTTFYNLTMNATKGVTENASEIVNNTLTLTNGTITLGSDNLTIGGTGTISGGNANSYVITNSTGTLSKIFNAAGTLNFAVGDNNAAGDYTPLSLTVNSASTFPGTVNVVAVQSKEPNNNNTTNYLNRYWNVTESSLGAAFSFNETGTYLLGDVVGTESAIASGFYGTSKPWKKYAAVNTVTHKVTNSSPITQAGDITGITLAAPSVVITPTTVCSNSPLITATPTGDPTFTYVWNTTETSASINATTGPYNVTATDGNGFVATFTATITVLTAPTNSLSSTAGTDAQTVCNNTAITDITYAIGGTATGASASGLPGGVNGAYSSGTFTISGTPTVSGVFTYTVITSGGACGTASVIGTIHVNALPNVTANSTATTTCAGSNITLTGGGADTYSWTNGVIDGVAFAPPTGTTTYTVTGTTTATGCQNNATIAITVNDLPSVTLSSVSGTDAQTVCNNSIIADIAYTISGTPTGATVTGLPTGVSGIYNAGTETISGTPTTSGNYTYTLTTTGGSCNPPAIVTGTINVNAQPSVSLSSASGTDGQTVCTNSTITDISYSVGGTATGAVLTGTLPAGVTGSFSSGIFTITGTPTISGNYTYTITTTGGTCSPQATTNGAIIVDSLPTMALSSATGSDGQTVCENSAIINITYVIGGTPTGAALTGTLPTGVSGTFSGNTFTITGTPTISGNYTYTITTTGGSCSPQVSANGNLNVNPSPSASISGNVIGGFTICSGNTDTLKASATGGAGSGYSFKWNDGNTNATDLQSTTGIYTLTITDGNGCMNTTSQAVTVNTLPNTTITGNVIGAFAICSGNVDTLKVSATGGAGSGYSFKWNDGNTTAIDLQSTAGTFTVIVTDGNGCMNTNNQAVIVNTLPTASIMGNIIGANTICAGNVDTLTASATGGAGSGYSFKWNDGTTTASNLQGAAGTYTVTVTDGNGCMNSANQAVTVNPLPTVNITGNVIGGYTVCSGNSDTLTAGATGGSGSGYLYNWNNFSSSATTFADTTGTYNVTVTDGNGCSNTASQAVAVNPTPTVIVTPNAPGLCPGGSVNMNAGGAASYTWSPATALDVTTGSSVNANPSSSITYTIVGTTGSCTSSQTAVVTVSATLNVTVTPATPSICLGGSITLNGNGAANYTWKTSSGLSCVTCPSPLANPSSTTTYTVVGTSGTCADSANVVVKVNTLPTVSITSDKVGGAVICSGSDTLTAHANGNGAFTYMWSTGATTNSITAASANTYSVTVTDGNGCMNTTSEAITVNSLKITVSGKDSINLGKTDTLSASGASNYLWSTGSTTSTDIVSPTTLTIYTVTGTDANGCHDTATFTVKVGPVGIANIGMARESTFLYPNPAISTVNLSFEMPGSSKEAVIKIIDPSGREISSTNVEISNGKVLPINISNLDLGMYFVKVITKENTEVVRFIKQ